MSLRSRFRTYILTWAILLLALGPTVEAQPAPSIDSFDLVLMGDALRPSVHTVKLKSNPTAGESWTALENVQCADTERVLVFKNQSVQRYLGQDIRENYLALNVTAETSGGALRSAYAVPSTRNFDSNDCQEIVDLVEKRPMVVRRHSLAVYERPRSASLRPDTPFIDHIEAPVRHRRPGVMEVEWLEILFR